MIVCIFSTLQGIRYRVQTLCGLSEVAFTGNLWVVPIQGVGQGNGAGPAIWALVSTPVLNMLRAEGLQTVFKANVSGDKLEIVGYAFVDDADHIAAAPYSDLSNSDYVAARMQEIMTVWQGGIHGTGGALVPEKSFWYPIGFKWTGKEFRYKKASEFPGDIEFPGPEGNIVKLRKLEPGHSERTLGVRTAPDGNWRAQAEYLTTRARQWADEVKSGQLPRTLVWQDMTTTIMKTLEYPLVATYLGKPALDKIMTILKKTGLPASGVSQTLSFTDRLVRVDWVFRISMPSNTSNT